MASYDDAFFTYVNSGALHSARRMLPELTRLLPIGSVLDVGCGQGAWLSVWSELGVETVVGLDGDYVQRNRLLIPEDAFVAQNLSRGFDLDRRFDLVQSLEVAEHLPEHSAEVFVQSLVKHGDMVLFSAAPKGQGGDHHVNEQDYDYWRERFRAHDYVAVDYLRPRVLAAVEVERWYRYNTFLYVAREKLADLPAELQAARVPDDQPLTDVSPATYRMRKTLVRMLPVSVATGLAKIKERLVGRARS